jgi:predicted O-methyltransferase YrrM
MSIREASSRKAAIRHPFASIGFLLGNKHALHRAIILESANYLFGNRYPKNAWIEALEEIERGQLIPQAENTENIAVGNNLNTTFGKWIYCCVRVLKPENMIETGVAHGASSWIILNAMHKNKKGKLFSIDLPDNDTNAAYNFKSKSKTGWIVPEKLRNSWELRLGDAKIILPEILNRLKQLDIFFHDSDHSYEHMKFEFETVIPYLSHKGIILSDDVHKNDAFREFTAMNTMKALQFNKGGCAGKE